MCTNLYMHSASVYKTSMPLSVCVCVSHCNGRWKCLASKFYNFAGISPTAKFIVQYEILPCNMTIYRKKNELYGLIILYQTINVINSDISHVKYHFFSTGTTFTQLIWDRHNLFEGRSPIMFRGRHEKAMYLLLVLEPQVYFLTQVFLIYILVCHSSFSIFCSSHFHFQFVFLTQN